MESRILKCEQIARIKYKDLKFQEKPDLISVYNPYNKFSEDWKYLSYILSQYTSHSIMILDKYEVVRDRLSDKMFVGSWDNVLIPAEANELFINNEQVDINRIGNKYKLPVSEEHFLEVRKYSYNHCSNKIDTLIVERKLVF